MYFPSINLWSLPKQKRDYQTSMKQYRKNKPHITKKQGKWYAVFDGYTTLIGDYQQALLHAGMR